MVPDATCSAARRGDQPAPTSARIAVAARWPRRRTTGSHPRTGSARRRGARSHIRRVSAGIPVRAAACLTVYTRHTLRPTFDKEWTNLGASGSTTSSTNLGHPSGRQSESRTSTARIGLGVAAMASPAGTSAHSPRPRPQAGPSASRAAPRAPPRRPSSTTRRDGCRLGGRGPAVPARRHHVPRPRSPQRVLADHRAGESSLSYPPGAARTPPPRSRRGPVKPHGPRRTPIREVAPRPDYQNPSVLEVVLAGLVTGWAIAIPIGAVGALLVALTARTRPHGLGRGDGVATVDGGLRRPGRRRRGGDRREGRAVRRLVAGRVRARAARIAVLTAGWPVAARAGAALRRRHRPRAPSLAGLRGLPRPDRGQPDTVVYFVAVVLGNPHLADGWAEGPCSCWRRSWRALVAALTARGLGSVLGRSVTSKRRSGGDGLGVRRGDRRPRRRTLVG